MGEPSPPQLHSYSCLLLNRELKAVRTVAFEAFMDEEAIETAAEMLQESPNSLALVGFELRKNEKRVLVHLTDSNAPPDMTDEEATLQYSQAN